jgi:DNA-directed RNA polymerase specialized sigma24 family protein
LKADSLRNDEAFSTWLFTIARNVIISHGRKRYRRRLSAGCPEGDRSQLSLRRRRYLAREELSTVSRVAQGVPSASRTSSR